MTTISWILYACVLFLAIMGIACLMEFYKKVIRKDRSKPWECKILALLLSIGVVFIIAKLKILKPIINLLGSPYIWPDYILYIIIFYFAQKETNLKLIKKLTKLCVKFLLEKAGFSDTQIQEIYNTIEAKNQ